jgi:hypothetical protein
MRATYPRVFTQLEVEVINQYSLLQQWQGSNTGEQPILLTGHMDVVPIEPGTESDWHHPPFAGVLPDGKIYGRGTLDDKSGDTPEYVLQSIREIVDDESIVISNQVWKEAPPIADYSGSGYEVIKGAINAVVPKVYTAQTSMLG